MRALLERGRLYRSGGDSEAAQPLFVAAFVLAKKRGDLWFAADAAHMVALVDDPEKWTQVGLELIEEHPELAHWLGPLYNNLGWYYFENERYEDALAAFEKTPAPYAAYGRAKTLVPPRPPGRGRARPPARRWNCCPTGRTRSSSPR